ncbi:MAG: PP2C family protein-serine/threonine phosphatase [Wujia sp.]
MIDSALVTKQGGREQNEDYILHVMHGDAECFILCDGLGGHACGEVASREVAEKVAQIFRDKGDSSSFLDDAFQAAQTHLLVMQRERNMIDAMKTTLVVLVVTDTLMKWAHIGDSRLYHFFRDNTRYERTRDHSMVQVMCDMGEIKESDIRHHEDRNKLLRVMGAKWGKKSYDKSAFLEREGVHSFALMTDGFWEYVEEQDMLDTLQQTKTAEEWLGRMQLLVENRADMQKIDNYSAICVRVAD